MVLDTKYSVPPYFTRTDKQTRNNNQELNVTSSEFVKCNGTNLYREATVKNLIKNYFLIQIVPVIPAKAGIHN